MNAHSVSSTAIDIDVRASFTEQDYGRTNAILKVNYTFRLPGNICASKSKSLAIALQSENE